MPAWSLSLRRLACLFALSQMVTACTPTCRETCRKLLDCDSVETSRLSIDECTTSCQVRQRLYDDWDDTQLQDSFDEYRSCVGEETCDSIAAGTCYDEAINIW